MRPGERRRLAKQTPDWLPHTCGTLVQGRGSLVTIQPQLLDSAWQDSILLFSVCTIELFFFRCPRYTLAQDSTGGASRSVSSHQIRKHLSRLLTQCQDHSNVSQSLHPISCHLLRRILQLMQLGSLISIVTTIIHFRLPFSFPALLRSSQMYVTSVERSCGLD